MTENPEALKSQLKINFFHNKTILSIDKKYFKIYKNVTATPITDKVQSFFLYNFFLQN